jgi:hypothetical protein
VESALDDDDADEAEAEVEAAPRAERRDGAAEGGLFARGLVTRRFDFGDGLSDSSDSIERARRSEERLEAAGDERCGAFPLPAGDEGGGERGVRVTRSLQRGGDGDRKAGVERMRALDDGAPDDDAMCARDDSAAGSDGGREGDSVEGRATRGAAETEEVEDEDAGGVGGAGAGRESTSSSAKSVGIIRANCTRLYIIHLHV